MKKTMKIINVLLMIMIISLTLGTVVNADKATVDSVIGTMDSSAAEGKDGIATIGGQIADILTTIGIVVAVLVILILGIKYMMGSASEKAEYKKTMIPYVVGAVLVLGGSAIVKIVFSTFQFNVPA